MDIIKEGKSWTARLLQARGLAGGCESAFRFRAVECRRHRLRLRETARRAHARGDVFLRDCVDAFLFPRRYLVVQERVHTRAKSELCEVQEVAAEGAG